MDQVLSEDLAAGDVSWLPWPGRPVAPNGRIGRGYIDRSRQQLPLVVHGGCLGGVVESPQEVRAISYDPVPSSSARPTSTPSGPRI